MSAPFLKLARTGFILAFISPSSSGGTNGRSNLQELAQDLAAATQPGAALILVDDGLFGKLVSAGYRTVAWSAMQSIGVNRQMT